MLIVSYLAKDTAMALCLVVAFVCFMLNISSRKEIPLDKIDNPPKLEPLQKTIKSYFTMIRFEYT